MSTWTGQFVTSTPAASSAPRFRRPFELDEGHGAPSSATLFLSALGVCEAWLNGEPVSSDLLTPGWSSYEWRVRYETYDVLALLRPASVLGVAVGHGWYAGRLGWNGNRELYGTELGAFAELRIRFEDGHEQIVATDASWQAGPSAVTADDLYDGEQIDGRQASGAWLEPGFHDPAWTGVTVLDGKTDLLTPSATPPTRATQELEPVRIWESPAGATLVDFGQNLVGWIRIKVRGESGAVVKLRHAEVLEHDELGVRPLRTALATDEYILTGGDDVFAPSFTFHGFRYAEVTGWPGGAGAIQPGDLTAVVVGAAIEPTGRFHCSHALVNQLHENVIWGMRGNFLAVPTDCPQRDERLGWTGDIAAFAPTACYLYDVKAFLSDWLVDLRLEQEHAGGVVPFVIPDLEKLYPTQPTWRDKTPTAMWADAAVWVPWALWQAYGDDTVLREQFESMVSHVRTVRSLLSPTGLWDTGFQFGDWLDPDAPPDKADAAKADKGVVATACIYKSARLVAETAALLGRSAEQAEFGETADALRAAFNEHYVGADGVIKSDCTTVYAIAIEFGLLSPADQDAAGHRLAQLAKESGFHISTGFIGTPFILDALVRTGHLDYAYELLLQTGNPSWLYPVTMGATTVWERWDSMLPDGSINPGQMTSFNHYAFGAVADWLHRTVGGIAPLEPGYDRILVAPRPGGGITSAATELQTRHGRAAVSWTAAGGGVELDITIPPGATGLLSWPGRPDAELASGSHHLTLPAGS